MDESWRMQMGMPNRRSRRHHHQRRHHQYHHNSSHHFPHRLSAELDTSATGPAISRRSLEEHLDPDDFADVFGGPPRSVILRKFSGDPSPSLYEEIFRQAAAAAPGKKGSTGAGRSLPAFRIPARGEEGFYSEVFGVSRGVSAEDRREGRMSRERSGQNSKAKSKSNSSSVLSSEELSPLRRTVAGDDVALSSFASKLRPINAPCRWNSLTVRPDEQQAQKQGTSSFQSDSCYPEDESFRSYYFKVSRQVSSPESISLEPNSFRSIKASVEDVELNSTSSSVSSLCQEPEVKSGAQCENLEEEGEMELEEDEVVSSYVIEVNSDHREGTAEAVSVDEAIAWAKEKFQAQRFDQQLETEPAAEAEERPSTNEYVEQHIKLQSPMSEMEALDEDIRLWSSGKETNIRLLLSTLHQILWPSSSWHAVPLTSLIESSNVKKAYQKARLCLHPDKLQQRGATVTQKFLAEKAFSILQEAWAAFISQDFLS